MLDGLAPGQVVAGCRLHRRLGQGAAGVVFLAEDLAAAQPVALKLVPLPAGEAAAAARAAFLRGAATGHRLVHPGIVRLHAAGVDRGFGWLTMEYLPGCDLGRYTEPQRLLPEPLVLQLGRRVALALGHAHDLGVVHRDLKPANVRVDWPSDTVKLVDFGLAREADAERTATGIVPGSPAYMAPEQIAGGVPTPQTDFYALGVMLFQLLSGRLPHEATSMGELLRAVVQTPAPDLRLLRPSLPPAVALLVAQLLAKRAADRPASGAALAAALATAWPAPP